MINMGWRGKGCHNLNPVTLMLVRRLGINLYIHDCSDKILQALCPDIFQFKHCIIFFFKLPKPTVCIPQYVLDELVKGNRFQYKQKGKGKFDKTVSRKDEAFLFLHPGIKGKKKTHKKKHRKRFLHTGSGASMFRLSEGISLQLN